VEQQELSLVAVLVEREAGDRRAFELSLLGPVEAVVEDRSDPVRNLLQNTKEKMKSNRFQPLWDNLKTN
jgi:hypothetical protein